MQKLAPYILGMLLGVAACGLWFVMSRPHSPDEHMNARQLMEWAQKCSDHKASDADCRRADNIFKSRVQRCDDRLKSAGKDPNLGANFSPADWLEYCDERFPELRD